jgi:hypothetical protein
VWKEALQEQDEDEERASQGQEYGDRLDEG